MANYLIHEKAERFLHNKLKELNVPPHHQEVDSDYYNAVIQAMIGYAKQKVEDDDNGYCCECGAKLQPGEGYETQIDGIVCDNCRANYTDDGSWKW